jgi:hypothetical protein
MIYVLPGAGSILIQRSPGSFIRQQLDFIIACKCLFYIINMVVFAVRLVTIPMVD